MAPGRQLAAVLGSVTVLAGSACGDDQASVTPGGGAGGGAVTEEAAVFGSTLWQIRGHHIVSLELYRAGDREFALAHAGHPIEEVLSSVEPDVRENDAGVADALDSALEEARMGVEEGIPADELDRRYGAALAAVRDAELAVVGEAASSSGYIGSVVAGLLATAGLEYGEAVPEGDTVSLLVEYQDAYGFLRAAGDLYGEIEGDVTEAGAEEAEEIEGAMQRLAEALPGPQPPATPAPAGDVESAAALVGHELEETVGAVVTAPVETGEVFDRIEMLLDQILAEYREGEAEEAAELAAEAYLENYELVEGEVIELAPDVNTELEPLLGAELRASIQEGVPVEELEGMIERARELLAQAREAVEGAED